MKLIIGLGNPGLRYKNTRHNIGFLVVKEISKKFDISVKRKKYKGLLGEGLVEGEKVTLLMPQTYMNLSGEAVAGIVKKEKISLPDILVIHDDLDLSLGFIRLREKGTSGGHKGLKSIIEHLGTSHFPRLRVGIAKTRKTGDVVRFVLTPFDSGEKTILKDAVNQAAGCAITWLTAGPEKAMTGFNRRQFT